MMKHLLLTLLLLAWNLQAFSDRGYGEYGAEYLKLTRHAYMGGLGHSGGAWTQDLAGLQFNPAILSSSKSHYLLVSNTQLSLERQQQGLAYYSKPKGNYTLGVEVGRFGIDGFEERDDNGLLMGSFDDREMFAELLFAQRIPGLFDYGVRLRYLNQRIGDWGDGRADGVGFDLGLLYEVNPDIHVGFSAISLGSKLYWWTDRADWIVPQFRVAYHQNLFKKLLQYEIDILKPWNQPYEGSLALQTEILKVLFLRAGTVSAINFLEDDISTLDLEGFFGVGVRTNYLGIDYAYAKPWSPFGASHKISLIISYPNKFVNF